MACRKVRDGMPRDDIEGWLLYSGYLLERGWADLFSTDFHGRPHLHLYIREAAEILEAMGGLHQYDILARENPSRLLEGRTLLAVPPISEKRARGFKEKMLDLLRGRERE